MLNDIGIVAIGIAIELLIGAYALLALQNYRQLYATIKREPRRSIIIGYKVVIGLSVVAALFMFALPWILRSGHAE